MSNKDVDMFLHDERIFSSKLKEWGVVPNEYSFVVLDNGIGDHFAFKSNINSYLEANKNKKKIVFACYPEVFNGIQDIYLASIQDAKNFFGNIDGFNLYKWMWDHNWKSNLELAYKVMLDFKFSLQTHKTKKIEKGTGNYIVISPYSQSDKHPKSYPYWDKLVDLINDDMEVFQIGRPGEPRIKGVDDFFADYSFKDIEELIKHCKFWISSDSFLPHLVNCMDTIVPGCAIYGPSDPELFGYEYNLNCLKSKSYLRENQFADWFSVAPDNDRFDSPEKVFSSIKEFFSV